MRTIYLLIAFFCQSSITKAQENPCPYISNTMLIQDYKSGMEFYFPKRNLHSVKNPLYDDYVEQRTCDSSRVTNFPILYSDLEDRHFVLVDTTISNYLGNVNPDYRLYSFFLEAPAKTDCKDTIIYQVVLDKNIVNGSAKAALNDDSYLIRGAIYEGEIKEAQNKFRGVTFYTIYPINGRRYEPVTITNIETGTWEAPIRIHFTTPAGGAQIKDISVAGTNVPPALHKKNQFQNFFSCVNPRPTAITDDNLWDNICCGILQLNMSPLEAELTVGKLKKGSTSITAAGTETEYSSGDYKLVFLGDKLIKINVNKI